MILALKSPAKNKKLINKIKVNIKHEADMKKLKELKFENLVNRNTLNLFERFNLKIDFLKLISLFVTKTKIGGLVCEVYSYWFTRCK